jgi:S-layer protein
MDVDVYDYDKISGFDAADLAKITGFEVLEITNGLADGDSFDVSKIAGITSFVSSGGVSLSDDESVIVSGLISGSSVTLSGEQSYADSGELVLQVKDAATGTADVLNLNLGTEGATVRVEAAGVETVNVNASGETADTVSTITLDLINNDLVTLNISGNDKLDFSAADTMTKLTTINASANTAGVDITIHADLTQSVTITGTAADDTIDLSANDVVNAGAGDDTITLANLAQVTGGAGEDTFVMTASANQVSYATILDFSTADDTIQAINKGTEVFNSTKITLAANAVFSDYVEAAAAGNGSVNGIISWFQFGGNTYLVQDNSLEANFVNGTDAIVEIVGLVDFSTAVTDGFLTFVTA